MSHIVITGGLGFVGLNFIARQLIDGQHDLHLIDDLSNTEVGRLEALLDAAEVREEKDGDRSWVIGDGRRFRLTVADVRDADVALAVVEGARSVIHLAAQTGVPSSLVDPRTDMTQNVVGTFNYLEACRAHGVRRFVLASSAAVIGNARPQRETARVAPISPYGASKAAAEGYCTAYRHCFGIETVALRFSNIYGPMAYGKSSVVAAFAKRGVGGQDLVVDGSGEQTRDFLHAADLARVIAAAAETALDDDAEILGNAVHVATGVGTSVFDVAQQIQAHLKQRQRDCEITFGPGRAADVAESAPEVGRLTQLCPDVSFRRLADGLPETIDWFLANWPPAGPAGHPAQ